MAAYCSFCLKDFKKRGKVRAVYRSDSIPEVSQLICSHCVAKIRRLAKNSARPDPKKEPCLFVAPTELVDGWLSPTQDTEAVLTVARLKAARKKTRALRELAATFLW